MLAATAAFLLPVPVTGGTNGVKDGGFMVFKADTGFSKMGRVNARYVID